MMQWVESCKNPSRSSWVPDRYASDRDSGGEAAHMVQVRIIRWLLETMQSPVLWKSIRAQLEKLDQEESMTRVIQNQVLQEVESAEITWLARWRKVED